MEHTCGIEEFKVVEGVHLGSFHIVDVGIVHIVLMWNSDCWAGCGIVRIVSWRIWRNHRSINLHRIRLFCAINDVADTEVDVVLAHHPVAPVASVSGRCFIFMTNSIRISLHQHSDGTIFLHRERAVLSSFVHSTNAGFCSTSTCIIKWVEEVEASSPVQATWCGQFSVVSRKACTTVLTAIYHILWHGMENILSTIFRCILDKVAITWIGQLHATLRNHCGSGLGRWSECQAVEQAIAWRIWACRKNVLVFCHLHELHFI